MNIKIIERGWAGHFISANSCKFRRNTLIDNGKIKIVVSTVGNMWINEKLEPIGMDRYYETMAFYSDKKDKKYHDADVTKIVRFDSSWSISYIDGDNEANEMHDRVVIEIKDKIQKGIKLEN
jgi:hypothetical protein